MKIETVADLKKMYPELSQKLIAEGAQKATQIAQNYLKERLIRASENIDKEHTTYRQKISVALVEAFRVDEEEIAALKHPLNDCDIDPGRTSKNETV